MLHHGDPLEVIHIFSKYVDVFLKQSISVDTMNEKVQ